MIVVVIAVVHDVQDYFFYNEVDLKEQVRRPVLVDGKSLNGGCNAVEFFPVGLNLN